VTTRVVTQGLEHGVFFYPGGTGVARDILCLGPAFVTTEAEIDQMAEVLGRSVREVLC
jgi:adenosylmethionine-8-amino-7-oxononanoate aminotransferase